MVEKLIARKQREREAIEQINDSSGVQRVSDSELFDRMGNKVKHVNLEEK